MYTTKFLSLTKYFSESIQPKAEIADSPLTLLLINSKNYVEASGEQALRLASAAEKVSKKLARNKAEVSRSVQIVLALPAFSLGRVTFEYPRLAIYTQHLDNHPTGSTTGYLIPEVAKSFGATGSLLNHSEHRIPVEDTKTLVRKLRELAMTSVVCARDSSEVTGFAGACPDYVAIEPPELIGSGVAISKARPELITDSRAALDRAISESGNKNVRLLCGAGIVDPVDAERSVELGAEGILVASGVVKSQDWFSSILGLANGLIAGQEKSGRLLLK